MNEIFDYIFYSLDTPIAQSKQKIRKNHFLQSTGYEATWKLNPGLTIAKQTYYSLHHQRRFVGQK